MPVVIPVTITIQAPPLAAAFMRKVGEVSAEDVPKLFPNTLRRLADLARQGQRIWMQHATQIPGQEGRPLRLGTGPGDPMVFLHSSQYAQSIMVEPMTMESGGAETVIGTSDRQAIPIEIGGPAIDLHAVLDYAPKARMSKKGKKYLLVPFRHATTAPGGPGGSRFQSASNVIPSKILSIMRTKQSSLVAKMKRSEPSVNYPGKIVKRNLYKRRGESLTSMEMARSGIDNKNLMGLFRAGARRHSSYLTIRTLTQANPQGWRIRAYPAQHLANKTAEELQRLAETWFEKALHDDGAGWVEQAMAS